MPKFIVDIDTHEANEPFAIDALDVEEALRPAFAEAVHDPVMDINVTMVTAKQAARATQGPQEAF